MNNLYIRFADYESRREFLLELMGLKVYDPDKDITVWNLRHMFQAARVMPKPGELERWFHPLEFGKMSSPYLNMQPLSGTDAATDSYRERLKPWNPLALAEKGLRRVYTLRSYRGRPGHWLALRFAANSAGRSIRQWVLDRVPPEQMGCHVKPPDGAPHKHHLTWAATVLDLPYGEKLPKDICDEVYGRLWSALAADRGLFAGDNVYLWENLAHRYSLLNDFGYCKRCCRIQAGLQPCSSDPLLNLGQYCSSFGYRDDALLAYYEGLRINPGDEYIHYNLASLLRSSGDSKKAFAAVNEAILSNPVRGVNFWLKGRLHAEQGDHHAAVESFRHAAKLMEEDGQDDWDKVLAATYADLAGTLQELDRPAEAAAAMKKARELAPDDKNISE